MKKERNNFFISTPIYYVNAPRVHIGHGITTIITDVRARFERLRGKDVFFSTGTDEHGSAVAKAADAAGVTPQAFADQNAANFRTTWEHLNIKFDDFIRTTEDRHSNGVHAFLLQLKESGYIYEGVYEGHYCTGCEAFKEDDELDEAGCCPIHKTKADFLKEKNWFFKLSELAPKVKELIEDDKIKILPKGRRNEVLSFLNGDVKDVSISRETVDWGIKLPFDEQQTTYVWIEALLNYITVVGFERDMQSFNKYWNEAERVHVLGKDISRFHCVIWPAMLLAVGFETPHTLFVHSFLKSEGHKMSKSLGNVVYPAKVAETFGVDGARYLFFSETPVTSDGDIQDRVLHERYNAELKNNVGNLFSRLTVLATKNSITNLQPGTHAAFESLVSKAWNDAAAAMEQFDPRTYLAHAQRILNAANTYLEEEKPWSSDDDERNKEVLTNAFELYRHALLMLSPVIPTTFDTVAVALNWEPSADSSFADWISWGSAQLTTPKENIHLFSTIQTDGKET